ncbi:MAG: DUF2169 family type VI secretion system accessory protein [Nannocystales bacterium]
MWELRNRTPFVAEWTAVLDKDGARSFVVVVKGTFAIDPDGTTKLADEQLPIDVAPEYHDDPEDSSLRCEGELTAMKPGTDIVVHGSAIPAEGKPVTRMTVVLQSPAGRKSLQVFGDRRWSRSVAGTIELEHPVPFVEMPIVYERAEGGFDKKDPDPAAHRLEPHNPVGTGFFTSDSHKVGELAPNIVWLERNQPGPAGLGPTCPHWKPRCDFQGTYDAQWVESRRPLLPEDYDARFLMSAPADQQCQPHLRGGEPLAVSGMHADGVVRCTVPKHYLAFSTHIGPRVREHRAKLVTVGLFPNDRLLSLTWQTELACHHEFDDIDHTVIRELPYLDQG